MSEPASGSAQLKGLNANPFARQATRLYAVLAIRALTENGISLLYALSHQTRNIQAAVLYLAKVSRNICIL